MYVGQHSIHTRNLSYIMHTCIYVYIDFQLAGPRIFKQYTFAVLTYADDRPGYVHSAKGDDDNYSTDNNSKGHNSDNNKSRGTNSHAKYSSQRNNNKYTHNTHTTNKKYSKNQHSSTTSSTTSTTINEEEQQHNQYYTNTNSIQIGNIISTNIDMHFSSSPGLLTSLDDFFVVNGRGDLAVMETRCVLCMCGVYIVYCLYSIYMVYMYGAI